MYSCCAMWVHQFNYYLSLSLFVLRQFSSLARVRRFPTSAMPPQRTILGRLFLQTPLFYRVLYFLLPSLNRSPYPPLPLHYQPPACRYHVPFVLLSRCPNHLNLPLSTTSATPVTPKRSLKSTLLFLAFNDTPHIHLTIIISVLSNRCMSSLFIAHVSLPYINTFCTHTL